MLALRPLFSSLLVTLLHAASSAQNPPPPANPPKQDTPPAPAQPVGPPAEAEAADKGLPEDRAEFDYKASGTEHPYVDIAGVMARDPRTGDLGVILISSSPGAGAFCVQADVNAGIAVVSGNTDPMWPEQAIELLRKGRAPADVLTQIRADASPSASDRQQAMLLGADGRTASFIGEYVFGAGKTTEIDEQENAIIFTTYGATPQLMAGLKKEFPATQGLPLPERLIVSMQLALDPLPVDKGRRADLFGKPTSAVLIILRKDAGRLGRGDRLIDLRIDFDQDPLARLRGLYRVWTLAHLGPALRASMAKISDQKSEAYVANREWMGRLRARLKLGEKR